LKEETPGAPEEAGPSTSAAAFGAGTASEDGSARVGQTLRQEAGPSGRAREAARTQECAFCLGDVRTQATSFCEDLKAWKGTSDDVERKRVLGRRSLRNPVALVESRPDRVLSYVVLGSGLLVQLA
jgi:hypothetical protein